MVEKICAPELKVREPVSDLLMLLENAIIERYDSELQKDEDPRTGGNIYTPLDTDALHALAKGLWGNLVHPSLIEVAVESLIEDGAEHWPHGWCEEDLLQRQLDSAD
jgi:hypothetical protein